MSVPGANASSIDSAIFTALSVPAPRAATSSSFTHFSGSGTGSDSGGRLASRLISEDMPPDLRA